MARAFPIVLLAAAALLAAVPAVGARTAGTGSSSLSVALAPNVTSVAEGSAVTFTTTVTGGTPPYQYAYSDLPAGCATSDGASLSCRLAASGNVSVSVTVHDFDGLSASARASVEVVAPTTATSPQYSRLSVDQLWGLTAAIVGCVAFAVVFERYRRGRPPRSAPAPPGGDAGSGGTVELAEDPGTPFGPNN